MISCAVDFSVRTYLDPIPANSDVLFYVYMHFCRNYFQNKSYHANISNKFPVHLGSTDVMNILRPNNSVTHKNSAGMYYS